MPLGFSKLALKTDEEAGMKVSGGIKAKPPVPEASVCQRRPREPTVSISPIRSLELSSSSFLLLVLSPASPLRGRNSTARSD